MRLASLLALLAAGSAVAAPAPFAKPDRPDHGAGFRPFQGAWGYVHWLGRDGADGGEARVCHVIGVPGVIAGNRLLCHDRSVTIRLDSKRSPTRGDVSLVTPRGVRHGVYELHGGALTFRTASPGKPRKSSFSLDNDGDEVITLRRTPPAR
jgi:hypothetical protein